MISIELCLDKADLLKSCRVSGHAGAALKGEDIVCAAVSALTRTAYTVLFDRKELKIRAEAPKRGEFWMEIDNFGRDESFLSAVGTFLTEGLKSISAEYPDRVVIHIQKELP
ncbi:MAG: ribosomal-processing cysteine protease Prp [Treponema sp.]|nr:ribosomal-processing cysteine protease Prp [Treponema sp.]